MHRATCRECGSHFELSREQAKRAVEAGELLDLGSFFEYDYRGVCPACRAGGRRRSAEAARTDRGRDLRLGLELADICEGVRERIRGGMSKRSAIRATVDQQMNAEESDLGFRRYIELSQEKKP